MEIIFAVLSVAFFIGIIVCLFSANEKNTKKMEKLALGCVIGMFLSLLGGTIANLEKGQYEPKEFSADKYTFKYKVIEMDGQRDTTYVITKIKK